MMQSGKVESWKDLKEKFSFIKEILDQPRALREVVTYYASGPGWDGLIAARDAWTMSEYRRVVITGMGSSLFAGRLLSLILNAGGIPCQLIDAGELLYYQVNGDLDYHEQPGGKQLFILVSQSGESAEILKLLGTIPNTNPGADIWGVTNTENSPLHERVGTCFFLKAGAETSVTSKTYLNSLLFMYLLGRVLVSRTMDEATGFFRTFQDEVKELAGSAEKLLDRGLELGKKMVEFLGKDVPFISVIARGTSLATAEQAGLNIKETDKIPCEAISAGQFRHGPIEMIDINFRSILLISDEVSRELNEQVAWDISHAWGGGRVIVITNKISTRLEGEPRIFQICHEITNPYLASVMEIIIIQLFMVQLALENDIEPGVFKYTSKVTKDG
ncbi:MAG: SIS domain-containing protein [Promethearchaeota archaeon]